MSFERPYEGIKVVDMSQGVAGPYCAMLLAQYGADVVKIEPPHGDWARGLGMPRGNHTEYSFVTNLGKRSLALDLKDTEAKRIVDTLVADADVFFEGFRPGVIDRLGFGHERLMSMNPGLIYVSISGFGQTGPLRDKPAMDPVLQAFTGFMIDNRGNDGVPHRVHTVVNDMSTALYAFQAVAPALFAKRDHAGGRFFDISLMRSAANLSAIRMMTASQGPIQSTARTAPSGVFQAADGWLQLVILQDKDFHSLCDILGLDDLKSDPNLQGNEARLAQAEMLMQRVSVVLLTQTAEHWRKRCTDAGLQNEVLLHFKEFLEHPQVVETGLFTWLEVDDLGKPLPVPNPPGMPRIERDSPHGLSPFTGQHSDEVLTELGYDAAAVAAMRERGAVYTWTGEDAATTQGSAA